MSTPEHSPDPVGDVPIPDVSRLVTEDDTPVDNIRSEKQMRLLTEPLYASWSGPPTLEDPAGRSFLVAANVGLFSSPHEPPVVPDVMLSLDVRVQKDWWEKRHRSYFVWEFGKVPDVVIELVSNTEGQELSTKRARYARLRIAHYAVWDPFGQLGTPMLKVFELRGDLLVPVERALFENIGLGLTEWEGTFEDVTSRWLRWCRLDGSLIPTGAERAAVEASRADTEASRAAVEASRADTEASRAAVEASRADTEARRADTEARRADDAAEKAARLEARLRALGVDPDRNGG